MIYLNPEHLAEARLWIGDSFWSDQSDCCPDSLSDEDVRLVVDRHYCGGWSQFGRDVDCGFGAD
jgi:hypothetical protein